MLGVGAVLNTISTILQREVEVFLATNGAGRDGVGAWQTVEACLFALRSISRRVPMDEATIIPLVMRFIPSLPRDKTLMWCVGWRASWLWVYKPRGHSHARVVANPLPGSRPSSWSGATLGGCEHMRNLCVPLLPPCVASTTAPHTPFHAAPSENEGAGPVDSVPACGGTAGRDSHRHQRGLPGVCRGARRAGAGDPVLRGEVEEEGRPRCHGGPVLCSVGVAVRPSTVLACSNACVRASTHTAPGLCADTTVVWRPSSDLRCRW